MALAALVVACSEPAATVEAPSPRSIEPGSAAPEVTTASPTTVPGRDVAVQSWDPYAQVGEVVLHLPSDQVEAIGLHQSGHDGAMAQLVLPGPVRWFVQGDRGRDTTPAGAADIVVRPDHEVRAPVSGTVRRAGGYALYCNTMDELVVIEPDAHQGWQVKVLHIEGLLVRAGQRVEAGVTPIAARSRRLPFASNVNVDTASPAWPHVHVEVVDPSVPDRPGGPGCA